MKKEYSNTVVSVWDPLVRTGHWLLVIGFAVAYIVEDDILQLHVWSGYAVGGVVLVRLIWGFVGTEHARFADFVRGRRKTFRYLVDLLKNRSRRYLGHSPAGGAMAVALLFCLSFLTVSGLMVYAYEEHAGPMTFLIADATEAGAAADAKHDAAEDFWEEAHEITANLTLFLVILHVLGVIIASRAHRENLVASMLHGRKRANDNDNDNDNDNRG